MRIFVDRERKRNKRVGVSAFVPARIKMCPAINTHDTEYVQGTGTIQYIHIHILRVYR